MFIDELKKQGVYDNSLIFIIADHGTRKIPINIQAAGLKETSGPDPIDNVFKFALPLILIKPFNSRGKLKTNNAPVTLADIGPTIFDELDIKNENRSMFKIKANDPSKRRFFMIETGRSEYALKMLEYEVSGFSWLKSSWKVKGKR